MRSTPIDPDLISRNFGQFTNAFWRRFREDLRTMLADKAKPAVLHDRDTAITEEVLYIGQDLIKGINLPSPVADIRHTFVDWKWYVSERTCPTGLVQDVYEPPEDELLRELQADPIDGMKQVIFVYGHTGHGKTTFLRHFFYHWLPLHCPNMFPRHVVIRVSMGLAGFGANIENDYDHKVHRALAAAFPWLLTPPHLLEVAKHQHRHNPAALAQLESDFPRTAPPQEILRWLSDFNNLYIAYAPDEIHHDLNRIVVEYLTAVHDVKFIFIMDNVDQTPQILQDRFYMLARHKLDWIRDIDQVVFILGVRTYLLDKVYKESVVQAFPNPPRVRIFPPPVHAYLAARICSFHAALAAKRYEIPMDDGKVVEVDKAVLRNMLDRFNTNFSDPNNDVILSRLSNYDLRRQSEFIQACLRSRSIAWCDLAHCVSESRAIYFSQFDILRAILHDDNALVAPPPDQMLLNLFACGSGSHFANSLNKWYILSLLSCADRSVERILAILGKLGHEISVSFRSIEDMLLANVITSPEGVRLKADRIESLTISELVTTLGREFLTNLPFNLIYIQAMAYLTPLDEDLVNEVPVPRRHEGATFAERMAAAAILLKQVRRDEEAQNRYVQADSEAVRILQENSLCGFADRIRESVVAKLRMFRDRGIVIYDDWDAIFDKF